VPGSRWPWRQTQAGDVFVDDPKSAAYNQWRIETSVHDWTSREDLTQYELGIVVEHNGERVPRRGSAIFIHSLPRWRATIGCTGMHMKHVHELLAWLAPEQHPLLVQVAGTLDARAQPAVRRE
jgi:L,D-peptidoglycan transpeptidase YkuD (ErfK/YbiS/YcfS/YnhG family)